MLAKADESRNTMCKRPYRTVLQDCGIYSAVYMIYGVLGSPYQQGLMD